MAIFVSIEDKDGDQIEGVFEIKSVQKCFTRLSDSFCLRFISDSEDAAFNQAQLPLLVAELGALGKESLDAVESDELARILSACRKITGKKRASLHFYTETGSE